MMFTKLNIIALLILAFIIVISIKNKVIRLLVSIFLSSFILLQIISVYSSGSLIDYKFYVHFNINDILIMQSLFSSKFKYIIAIGILLPIFFYFSRSLTNKIHFIKNKVLKFAIILLALIIFSLKGGVFSNIIDIVRIHFAKDYSFELALENLKMENYVAADNVSASSGKNIVIISLESFERGFLHDNNAHLTPNIRMLKENWNYYDMNQTVGCDWTSSSLYALLTGLPAFFRGNLNHVFYTSKESSITSIGHVLEKANYSTTFLVGNSDFAGTKSLLNAFRIFNIIDKDNSTGVYSDIEDWGMHDKDLFEEAKLIIDLKKNKERPFCLIISTISTHFTDGIYDKRMEETIDTQNSNLEFMIAAVDYMVGDFMKKFENEGLLDNTIFYIFPDHLFMGNHPVLNNTGDRSLYLITNASQNNLNTHENETIFQIDLPKIILEGAEIKNNAKFLSDYITIDKSKFINENKALIASLNNAGLYREFVWIKNDLNITLSDFGSVRVSFDKNFKEIDAYKAGNYINCLPFDYGLKLGIIRQEKFGELNTGSESFSINFIVKNNYLQAFIKKGENYFLEKKDKKEVSYSLEEISLALEPSFRNQQLIGWERNQDITIGSSRLNDASEYIVNIPYNFSKGVIELSYSSSNDSRFVLSLDADSIKKIKTLPKADEKRKVRLAFKDTLINPLLSFRNLSETGLVKIHGFRIVGYGYDNGNRFNKRSFNYDVYANDTSRFIAHAGGVIDGHIYTNSLEALNKSYKKGFRLFELDIIKTSDNKYVAAHDWDMWAEMTSFIGILPPSEEEFLKHKIYGKYTPLNIEAINKWFSEHTDAILVTDKINEPSEFSKQFIDKSRLMMELFSIGALIEGVRAGIKSAMPSDNVLNDLGQNRLKYLKKIGISDVVLSRTMIAPNIRFVESLKNNNINVFVYYLNYDEGKDEDYVVTFEMDYVYGLYADDWQF